MSKLRTIANFQIDQGSAACRDLVLRSGVKETLGLLQELTAQMNDEDKKMAVIAHLAVLGLCLAIKKAEETGQFV